MRVSSPTNSPVPSPVFPRISTRSRRPRRTGALVAATGALVMLLPACGGGIPSAGAGGGPTTDSPSAGVNVWAAGDAAIARCEALPAGYVAGAHGAAGVGGGSPNVWAAGDAAVAAYFDQLAGECDPR